MNHTDFVSVLESRAFDESKHVNYTLGMLLGVDDFHQEFAYLAGRDRRLARGAVGYGTFVGLRVALDTADGVKGPRVMVEPGSALTPRGYLVCVSPTQCAYLDEWLTAKRRELQRANVVVPGTVRAHVVLGYHDCPSDEVLIPGSPCRDEDEMKIASRVSDSFRLEIRHDAPRQHEEQAVIDYVDWLRGITVGGPATPLADFEQALVTMTPQLTSPPETPAEPGWFTLRFDPPPPSLRIDPLRVRDYVDVALRLWTTKFRALVHPLCSGGQGCCSGARPGQPEPEDLLLLARVDLPVVEVNGDWRVDQTKLAQIVLDESTRPLLLHTRMLQELATGRGLQNDGGALAYRVAAAGTVNSPGAIVTSSLAATSPANGKLKLTFDGYQDPRTSPPSFSYVVKALPANTTNDNPVAAFDSFAADGILLNVTRGGAPVTSAALAAMPFQIEVSRLG